MIKPDIDVHLDYVLFDRRRIDRPKNYSVGQWMEFWEKVKSLDELVHVYESTNIRGNEY